jgi:hypothetical protein
MSRVLVGLVALSLVALPDFVSASQTFMTTQGTDGGVRMQITPGQAPPRDAPPTKTGSARIRGRVVAADNGQPLRRTSIRLSSPELREGKGTTTDQEGRYEFTDLPAGRYSLTAVKTGYVTISYGQRRPNEAGRPLDLADKQIAERVDFVLPRAGIITGRVVDEYGEPVANVMVQPMLHRTINGVRQLMPSGQSVTTPDTGEFRLWGLTPGDYYVAVNARSMNMGLTDQTDDRSGYAATTYLLSRDDQHGRGAADSDRHRANSERRRGHADAHANGQNFWHSGGLQGTAASRRERDDHAPCARGHDDGPDVGRFHQA